MASLDAAMARCRRRQVHRPPEIHRMQNSNAMKSKESWFPKEFLDTEVFSQLVTQSLSTGGEHVQLEVRTAQS